MELSRQADYAVRAMVDLAAFPIGTRVLTGEIAKRQEIPASFLPRIVAALSKAQLVQTFRGKDGGIMLARPVAEINLLDIIQAVEGPICLNRCTYQPSRCNRAAFCRVHPIWQQAQDYIDQLFRRTTLADLVVSLPQVLPLPQRQVDAAIL
ncbi:MAG: Rrf2 family transcriptional regulator [Chloroflexi bacterium]|nr:Rrf2 family transcriptional regulator [Chloroflexota bacterium]